MEKNSFESTQDIFDLWLKTYKAAMGKIIEMPALGPSREKYEKTMAGFSSFVNLYSAWMDTNVNFQSVFVEAMRRMQEKAATRMEGEAGHETNNDFYKIWIETYSETFKEFAKSDHFASDMGKLMSHFMDFQKYNQEMLEEHYLKPMNLPTKSELDEINKELYSLKKTIKELNVRSMKIPTKEDIDRANTEIQSLKKIKNDLKSIKLKTSDTENELKYLKTAVAELVRQGTERSEKTDKRNEIQ